MTNHNGPVIAERDGLTAIQCRVCGFSHLDPLPSADALDRFYSSDFWETDKPGEVARATDQAEWLGATYADWLTVLEGRAPGRTLLDVGCGYGWFLQAAALREWRVAGIEPSNVACEYVTSTMSLPIVNGSWENSAPGVFDAIAAHWVIEHVPDPAAFLRWCRANLYSGGALLLVCPNEWTLRQERANDIVKKQNWFIDKTHCSYFNQASLANLLGRTGFRVVEWLATYPMEEFILNGKGNYVDNADIGVELHRSIEQLDLGKTRDERLSYYARLAKHGEGRDIVVVATPE